MKCTAPMKTVKLIQGHTFALLHTLAVAAVGAEEGLVLPADKGLLSAKFPASLLGTERACIFKVPFQATELVGGEDPMLEPPSLIPATALDLPALPQLNVPLHRHK